MVIHQPPAALYFLRKKMESNLTKLMSKFSPDSQFSQIIESAKTDVIQFCTFLREIHRCFSEFQNKYLPFKSTVIEYQPNAIPVEMSKLVASKIYDILRNLKSWHCFPSLDKIAPLLELAKLTDDLIECFDAYVDASK